MSAGAASRSGRMTQRRGAGAVLLIFGLAAAWALAPSFIAPQISGSPQAARRRDSQYRSPNVARRAGNKINVPGDITTGVVLLYQDEPWKILSFNSKKVAKGGGITKAKVKNLVTGAVLEHRYNSGESYPAVDLTLHDATFSYEDSGQFMFMDSQTYETESVSSDEVGEAGLYIQPGAEVKLEKWEDKVIGFRLKDKIIAKVVDVGSKEDKRDKSSAIRVTLENGEQKNGPFYLKVGDYVELSTNFEIKGRVDAPPA